MNSATPSTLSGLSSQELKALRTALEREKVKRDSQRLLELYRPYTKQREFHARGATKRERLLMAGNQLGKSLCGAAEAAYHLTGLYPDDWEGRRFDRPVRGWAGSKTNEVVRDTAQRYLLGDPKKGSEAWGTGFIPRHLLTRRPAARQGTAGAVVGISVRHSSGGTSSIDFKSYDQGREKWQGETLDFVWFDEEPPFDIYMEGLTRTNATGGFAYLTFTPLLGMSLVVDGFIKACGLGADMPADAKVAAESGGSKSITRYTIEDAEHFTPAQRAEIIAGYPAHERDARTKGIPILGSGRIFPVMEDDIVCDPFAIPPHWPQIVGVDFGYDHPFAATLNAWDRETDTWYITNFYRQSQATPVLHSAAIKAWGSDADGKAWIPVSWPHDGLQHDKGSGEELASQYRKQGLNMLPERATFEDGGNGVEAGIMEMLDRMQTGRFKVFKHLGAEYLEEFRLYHRKDGKIVKERDDLISSSRYALMMRRHAITKPVKGTWGVANSKWVV